MRAHTISSRAVARQNIRADRSGAERGRASEWERENERERERERIEGARRNATGLSSPLINTSKATCKAARVGSRVQLDSGNPYVLSNHPSTRVTAYFPHTSPCLFSLYLSLSLYLSISLSLSLSLSLCLSVSPDDSLALASSLSHIRLTVDVSRLRPVTSVT